MGQRLASLPAGSGSSSALPAAGTTGVSVAGAREKCADLARQLTWLAPLVLVCVLLLAVRSHVDINIEVNIETPPSPSLPSPRPALGEHQTPPEVHAESGPDHNSRRKGPKIFIGVLSGAKKQFAQRRAAWRADCLSCKGWDPDVVKYRFIIGRPTRDVVKQDHIQGARAEKAEIKMATSLERESKERNDIFMVTSRDFYTDTGAKTLELMRAGVDPAVAGILNELGDAPKTWVPDYVVKLDDDNCLDLARFRAALKLYRGWNGKYKIPNSTQDLGHGVRAERTEQPEFAVAGDRALFMGQIYWGAMKYDSQKGADNRFDPYYGGWVEILSARLARAIAIEDRVHSVLYEPYGKSTDDLTLGKWVRHSAKAHQLAVDYVTVDNLVRDVSNNASKIAGDPLAPCRRPPAPPARRPPATQVFSAADDIGYVLCLLWRKRCHPAFMTLKEDR